MEPGTGSRHRRRSPSRRLGATAPRPAFKPKTSPTSRQLPQPIASVSALLLQRCSKAFPMTACWAKKAPAAKARAVAVGLSTPLMARAIMSAAILSGPICWRSRTTAKSSLGVVNLPGLGLLYSASKGGGAFCNGKSIKPTAKSEIGDSVLCFSGFPKMTPLPFKDQFLDWASKFWAVRGLGGAADAMMVCSGQAEVWIEAKAEPWDFAALKIVAEESGARYFNFDGGSTIYAGNCVICAPGWEQQMLARFRAES